MILDYFTNLLRVTCGSIDSWASQQQKAATVKEDQSGVKKAADEEDGDIINNQPFQSDIRALVDNYGPLYQGMIIETDLQTMLEICPRQRRRSDAYNSLVNYLGREHGVTLLIHSRKSIKQQENEQEQEKNLGGVNQIGSQRTESV